MLIPCAVRLSDPSHAFAARCAKMLMHGCTARLRRMIFALSASKSARRASSSAALQLRLRIGKYQQNKKDSKLASSFLLVMQCQHPALRCAVRVQVRGIVAGRAVDKVAGMAVGKRARSVADRPAHWLAPLRYGALRLKPTHCKPPDRESTSFCAPAVCKLTATGQRFCGSKS